MNCSVVSAFINLHCADYHITAASCSVCLYSMDLVSVTKKLKIKKIKQIHQEIPLFLQPI